MGLEESVCCKQILISGSLKVAERRKQNFRSQLLLSPLCYFEGPRNKYLLAAHRLFKTHAAGWKNNKKNNSRSASFFLSSDLCSWVEEQEEKQQQVEHTCWWKLVALQDLLTETEATQDQSAKSSS